MSKAKRQSAVALILDLVHKTVRFLAPDAAVLRLSFSIFRSPCVIVLPELSYSKKPAEGWHAS